MIEPRRSARLTLLAIRSGVPNDIDFREDVVRLGHRGRVLGLDAAVAELAALPKPVGCWTSAEDGILVINLRDRGTFASGGDWASLEETYVERYGPDFREQLVLCLGRFEWMILTFGEIMSWEAEYSCVPMGWQGNPFAHVTDIPADAREAATRMGVAHVHDHRPGGAPRTGTEGRLAITRRDPPADAGTCARCNERQARFVVEWFLGERPRRALCQRCIDEEIPPDEFDMGRMLSRRGAELAVAERTMSRQELVRMAEEEAMYWSLRHMPPFIRAFIQRHR